MSEKLKEISQRYNIKLKTKYDDCYEQHHIEEAQRQTIETIKQFYQAHLAENPDYQAQNIDNYKTLVKQLKSGEIRQLRQIPLWENPTKDMTIRYLSPDRLDSKISHPVKIKYSGATFIWVKDGKQSFKIPRTFLIFEEIYAPWETIQKNKLKIKRF